MVDRGCFQALVSRFLLSVSVNLRIGVVLQRTRLEIDRPVDGVSLDAVAGVAEGYAGRGGHDIAAEHAPAMASTGRCLQPGWSLLHLLGFSLTACSSAASSKHARGLRLVPSVYVLAPPSLLERLIQPTVALLWGGIQNCPHFTFYR